MVQTKSAAKRIESVQVTEDTPIASSSSIKKRDTVAPKTRSRGDYGGLGIICQLNHDALFLIAVCLHPMDLVNFTRTCESFQQLFMNKSSEFVWKIARSQVDGLPDCPADLTEQEYATLAFDARCHGCGTSANSVLWRMRRRYCYDCRVERFCSLYSCHEVIRRDNVIAIERVTIDFETTAWVETEQVELFMHEYQQFTDEGDNFMAFINEKKERHTAICQHARQCEKWPREIGSVDLGVHPREQEQSVFWRLKRLGYEYEVELFGPYEIQRHCKALFRKSKLLTNEEWDKIWPECIETMNSFRSKRLENRDARFDSFRHSREDNTIDDLAAAR